MAQQVKSTLQEDSRKFQHQPRQRGLMEEHLRTHLRGCPVVTGKEPGPGNGRKIVKEEMALGGKGCSQLQGRHGSHLQQVQGAAGSGRHRPGQILALKQWDPSKYWKPCWQEFFNCLVDATAHQVPLKPVLMAASPAAMPIHGEFYDCLFLLRTGQKK